jgi:hypothetical protein
VSLLTIAVAWLFARGTEAHTGRLRELVRARVRPAARGVTTPPAEAMGPPFQQRD